MNRNLNSVDWSSVIKFHIEFVCGTCRKHGLGTEYAHMFERGDFIILLQAALPVSKQQEELT